jgi:hypothetical protein
MKDLSKIVFLFPSIYSLWPICVFDESNISTRIALNRANNEQIEGYIIVYALVGSVYEYIYLLDRSK